MNIMDHVGVFFALMLAGVLAIELRRCRRIRAEHGIAGYSARRLRLRIVAFVLLEGALAAYLAPRALGLDSPAWQMGSLGMGLVLALAAMIPVLRDWRDMRAELAHEHGALAHQAAEQLKRALEEELRRKRSETNEDEGQA